VELSLSKNEYITIDIKSNMDITAKYEANFNFSVVLKKMNGIKNIEIPKSYNSFCRYQASSGVSIPFKSYLQLLRNIIK